MVFGVGSQGIEQHGHSEPVRTLVWESPSNFGLLIVIQTVLLYRFPEFIHEKLCFYSGDCHASVRYFIAMTGKSAPRHRTTERYRAAQGRNDYTYLAHDLAARPASKFQFIFLLQNQTGVKRGGEKRDDTGNNNG
ncbi:MAG: hypothetical protein ACI4P4_15555 [Faecousia sp.]